jgi:hypothetical protein
MPPLSGPSSDIYFLDPCSAIPWKLKTLISQHEYSGSVALKDEAGGEGCPSFLELPQAYISESLLCCNPNTKDLRNILNNAQKCRLILHQLCLSSYSKMTSTRSCLFLRPPREAFSGRSRLKMHNQGRHVRARPQRANGDIYVTFSRLPGISLSPCSAGLQIHKNKSNQ